MKRTVVLLVLCLSMLTMAGCRKHVQAPVPGAVDTVDANFYRTTSDAQAAIHSVKIWQQCSLNSFPVTVTFDNTTEKCDPQAGTFPAKAKTALNAAINAYNTAQSLGKAYHSGASNDQAGLTNAINQLSQAIANMLTATGGK